MPKSIDLHEIIDNLVAEINRAMDGLSNEACKAQHDNAKERYTLTILGCLRML